MSLFQERINSLKKYKSLNRVQLLAIAKKYHSCKEFRDILRYKDKNFASLIAKV